MQIVFRSLIYTCYLHHHLRKPSTDHMALFASEIPGKPRDAMEGEIGSPAKQEMESGNQRSHFAPAMLRASADRDTRVC
jgi:hypothetical protein